jgi:hypothetical protein
MHSMPSTTRTPTPARTVPHFGPTRSRLMSADRRQPTGITMSSDPCRTVAQIEHIALVTNDLESLSDFYTQLGGVASPPSTDPDTGLDPHGVASTACHLRMTRPWVGRRIVYRASSLGLGRTRLSSHPGAGDEPLWRQHLLRPGHDLGREAPRARRRVGYPKPRAKARW